MIPSWYGPEEARGVWVYLETARGRLENVSRELLGIARSLADQLSTEVTGVVIGADLQAVPSDALAHGADVVLLAEHPELEAVRTEPFARVLADAVAARKPDVLLLGATPDGRDLAGRLAVRLRTGLTADCIDLAIEPGTDVVLGHTTGFGGGVTATIKCPRHRPQMATVRPGVFPVPIPRSGQTGRVERLPVHLRPEDTRVEVLERVTEDQADLTRARVLVVGGRGVQGDFSLLEQLASELGGEVGATRVAVDKGWIDRARQIGQTGFVTRPDLAVVCGTSGAMQFTVGIKHAGTIVAINVDPEAPIFEDADYCVVDDFRRVVPPLIRKLQAVHELTPGAR